MNCQRRDVKNATNWTETRVIVKRLCSLYLQTIYTTHQAVSSEMVRSLSVATAATCESNVSCWGGWRRAESTKKYGGDGVQFIATARAIDQSTPADRDENKTKVKRGRGQAEERNVMEEIASANVVPDETLIDTDERGKERMISRLPEQGRCTRERVDAKWRMKGYGNNNGLWHPVCPIVPPSR